MKLRNRQNDRNATKTGERHSDKGIKERRTKIKDMNKGKRFSGNAGNANSVLSMTIRRTWRPVQRMLAKTLLLAVHPASIPLFPSGL